MSMKLVLEVASFFTAYSHRGTLRGCILTGAAQIIFYLKLLIKAWFLLDSEFFA